MRALPLLVLLALLAAPIAAAHATPVRTSPKQGERLSSAPSEVWAEFSERLESETRLAVIDPHKEAYHDGPTRISGTRASVQVRPLPDGGYYVEWRTLSAVDGHEASGAWSFSVGNATPPATPEVQEPPLRPGSVLGKALAFGGLALLVGALAFQLLVHQADPWRLERWGAAAHLLGLTVFAMSQGGSNPSALADYLSQTEYGRGLLLRLMLATVVLVLTLPNRLARPAGAQLLRAALAIMLLLAYGAASHTAGYMRQGGWGLDAVHLAAVCVWSGALLTLASLLAGRDPAAHVLRRVVDRFSVLAFVCVLIAAASGVAMLLVLLGRPAAWREALESRYGIVVALKVILAFVMMGFGAVNRLVHVRALHRKAGFDRPEFARNVRRESIVAAAIFLVAAVATNLSPAVATGEGPEPFVYEAEGESHLFRFEADPAPTAGNSTTLRVTVRERVTGELVSDAIRLRVTLESDDPETPASQFLLDPAGNGTYEKSGSFFFSAGRWHVTLFIQTPRTFADSAEFSLDVR